MSFNLPYTPSGDHMHAKDMSLTGCLCHYSIQAIILIALLGADIILDVICLFRAQKPWPTWGLVVRSICGIGYVAVFLVYVGLGRPFPEGYTYWKLSPDLSAPVVYILLCVIG